MKILILANNDVGLYQFRKELIEALLQHHQVMISLPDGALVRPLEDMGCTFINTSIDRRGVNPITDLSLLVRYFRILSKEKPDLVITYTIKPNIYGGFACRVFRIPYAVNVTGLGTAFQKQGVLRKLITTMYRVALKRAKVVFFENCENQRILIDEGIVQPIQGYLLNGAGVNLDHYSFVEYPKETTIHFLFMGRIMKEKGVDELFTVMHRLHEEGQDCVLDVLGNYEEDYASLIEHYKEEGWLNYYGYQKDVRPFIKKAHCFVLPSWHEGMANTNLECAAMGRPVITSRIHGCMESVLEGESGFICQPHDANSLYQVLKRFLTLQPEQHADMGHTGRKHMEALFDKRKVVEQTLKGLGL